MIISVLGVVVYFIFLKTESQIAQIQKLNDEIEFLKTEYQPIRFKVKDRKNGETTVLVKFYNLEGEEIKKEEFTLEGQIISFDFYVVEFTNGYLAFPYKIFTDEIEAAKGIELFEFYDKKGFPETHYKKNASKIYTKGLKLLFSKLKSHQTDDFENIFGSMVQNNSALAMDNRDIDVWYKIIVHTAGGIEIIED